MLGGAESPVENTAQSCLESDGSSVGWALRRVRRLPVPGFEICPKPGLSGGRQVSGKVGLSTRVSSRVRSG